MLGNIGIKQYYYFPGCFREEGCDSQISKRNKNNKIMTEKYKFISKRKYTDDLRKQFEDEAKKR